MPDPAIAQTADHRKLQRIGRIAPVLILVAGAILSGLVAAHLQRQESDSARYKFEWRARELASGIERHLELSTSLLRGVAGLFASSKQVDVDEFRQYVAGLQLAEHYPGIRAVGFTPLVAHRAKVQHVAAVRRAGLPDYDITPSGERPEYAPFVYLEPRDRQNLRLIGHDLLAEPLLRKAALRARDDGTPVLSEKVTLIQEATQDSEAGVLVFLPVYHHQAAADSVGRRRAALVGWASLTLRMGPLLQHYLSSQHRELAEQIALQVLAGDDASTAVLLHENSGASALTVGEPSVVAKLPMLGTTWWCRITASPAYWHRHTSATGSRAGLVVGLALTLLIAASAWVARRSHERIAVALQDTRRAHRTLAEREGLLRTIYDNSTVAMFLTDLEGRIIVANERMAEMFGYALPDLIDSPYHRLVVAADRLPLQRRFSELMAGEQATFKLDQKYCRSDRTEFWGHTAGSPLHDADGRVAGLVAVIEDVTERRNMEQALRASELRYRLLADNATDVIWTIDLEGHVTYVSPSVSKLRGCSVNEAMQQPLDQWFSASSALLAGEAVHRLLTAARSGQRSPEESLQLEQRCKNGTIIWTETTLSGFFDASGRAIGILGVTRDITERKRIQDRLIHLANHDALTDLPNRVLLADRIDQALALARRARGRIALLLLDLDRFKPVNDMFGHAVGDTLLQEAARRLRACIRDSDTVARIGGDEFVVMLPNIQGHEDALRVAQKIRLAMEDPFQLGRRCIELSATIGVAIYPEHGIDGIELMQNADVAMYRAKTSGRNRIAVFAGQSPITEAKNLWDPGELWRSSPAQSAEK